MLSNLLIGLALLFVTVAFSVVVVMLLKIMKSQEKTYQAQRLNWELERERLLNRLMTHSWTDYSQVNQNPISLSTSSDVVGGMSDEEELRRFAAAYNETVGVGEELLDMSDDLRELGIETS
jgi:hypothetical protein